MKKLTALLLAMVMCLGLVACGENPNQPVIDAFNAASTAYDAVANTINENIEAYPQELIDVMNEMADSMLEVKELLESDVEIPAENAAELIANLADVEAWANDVYASLDDMTVDTSREAIVDAFNYVSERFDAISIAVNENIEAYDDEFIAGMVSIAEGMIAYKEALDSGVELTEEDSLAMLEELAAVNEWIDSLEG